MTNAVHHPPAECLEFFLLNRLDSQLLERVEEHLLVCDSCRIETDLIQDEIEMLQLALA